MGQTASPASALASWYTPGDIDGFGDRLLMFDNTNSQPLEILRFQPPMSTSPGFERALRTRCEQLRSLAHPAFPAIRAVKRMESDGVLALISTHTPGKRLSTLLAEPRLGKGASTPFVLTVARQVVHALAALHAGGDDIAHSVLTADRVVLTAGAEIRITEHVLSSAVQHLSLSPSHLWREFGIVMPHAEHGVSALDTRTDVFQVGVLALSLLLGRRLSRTDVEVRLQSLLDQWAATTVRADFRGELLRLWLARALQLTPDAYDRAASAYDDLEDVSADMGGGVDTLDDGGGVPAASVLSGHHLGVELERSMVNRFPGLAGRADAMTSMGVDVIDPDAGLIDVIDTFPRDTPLHGSQSRTRGATMDAPARQTLETGTPSRTHPQWNVLVLAAVATVEAAVIVLLLMRPTPAGPTATPPGVGPAALSAGPQMPGARASDEAPRTGEQAATLQPAPTVAPRSVPARAEAAALAIEQAAKGQTSGGVRLSVPIEVKVFQGDRVLGSSADGPVVMPAGTYQLDLINTVLGFRARQSVTFRAGQIATVTVPIPRGRISVNAQPWAEVSIDDRHVGDTPLANIDVSIGEHEVVFRHPQLGERRQNVIVRADVPTRLSMNFDR